MYISCIFHVVCASFSASAMRKLADTKADSSGIWALEIVAITYIHLSLMQLERENYDFFPLNRALSLQHEEDNNEIRLETLMSQVTYLVTKMKEEVRQVIFKSFFIFLFF